MPKQNNSTSFFFLIFRRNRHAKPVFVFVLIWRKRNFRSHAIQQFCFRAIKLEMRLRYSRLITLLEIFDRVFLSCGVIVRSAPPSSSHKSRIFGGFRLRRCAPFGLRCSVLSSCCTRMNGVVTLPGELQALLDCSFGRPRFRPGPGWRARFPYSYEVDLL